MVMFLITLSFLFTAPGLSPEWSGFLMKDLLLAGAAIWTAGDALHALERHAA
jgi:reactive chlorine resistance protein C